MNGTSEIRDDSNRSADQRVTVHGVSWNQYAAMLAMRGEAVMPRIAYLEGELELMAPSWEHEDTGRMIARLLEAWAEETDTPLNAAGSMTVKLRRQKRGAEADECYILGARRERTPDLAIEVIWTSGGIDKLDIYRGLGVKEVWFWRRDVLEVYVLGKKGYERRKRSALLSDLDLNLLTRFIDAADQTRGVRAYRAALRRH